MQLNLSLNQVKVLGEILDESAKQQEAWITAKHTTEEERKAAREKLVVIRSIQAGELS